jgi:hypothetical protein
MEEQPDYAEEFGWYDSSIYDDGFKPKKNEHTKRVLILGDSFVRPEGFPKTFHEKMNEDENIIYDVESLATYGWGTDQQYLAFNKLALPQKPEIVILAYCLWNDIANNLSRFHLDNGIKPFFTLKKNKLALHTPDGIKQSSNEKFIDNIHQWLYTHSRIYFYGLRTISPLHSNPLFEEKGKNIDGGMDSVLADIPNDFPYVITDRISHYLAFIKEPQPLIQRDKKDIDIQKYGYELTFAILDQFNKEISEYGGEFHLFILPLANPYGWKSGESEQWVKQPDGQMVLLDYMNHIEKMKEYAKQYDISVIDITKEMEEKYSSGKEIINGSHDIHFNKLGNEFVGNLLAEYIKSDNVTVTGANSIQN